MDRLKIHSYSEWAFLFANFKNILVIMGFLLNFPIIEIQCPNNCSDRGNCTVFGICVCEPGNYGSDCGQGM